jgi:hypothetical protein
VTPVTSAADLSAAPPGSTGRCRKAAADAGAESPAALAGCPDVLAYVRGDGIETSAGLPKVSPSVMPDWDLDALRDFACAYACAPAGSAAHLLAWSVVEDDRPLRNHNAVFAIEHAAPAAKPKWSVVVMYRHATNAWWNIEVSFHSRARPVRHGPRAPSSATLHAILDENRWQWAEADGFRVLAGNTIDPLWTLVTGEAPTRLFPPNIER